MVKVWTGLKHYQITKLYVLLTGFNRVIIRRNEITPFANFTWKYFQLETPSDDLLSFTNKQIYL